MNRLRWLFATAILLVALIASGCGGEDDAEEAGAPAEVNILLSYREAPAWIGLLVARDQGFFEDERLELTTDATEGSDFVVQQIIAKNADIGMAAATSIVVAHSKDASVRAVFCNTVRNIFGISVPEDSEIRDVSGFGGKTLGISEGGGGETPMVEAVLREAGIEPNVDVKLVAIGGSGPASAKAIQDGRVDGYASSFSDIIGLRAAGVALRDITPGKYAGTPGDCLVTRDDVLADAKKRDLIVRIARAWSKGSLFATANPKAAVEIGCKLVPEDCQNRSFADLYMTQRLELVTPVGKELAQTEIPYGMPEADGWETAVDLLLTSGGIKESVDVQEVIGTDDVRQVIDEWSAYDREEIISKAEKWSG